MILKFVHYPEKEEGIDQHVSDGTAETVKECTSFHFMYGGDKSRAEFCLLPQIDRITIKCEHTHVYVMNDSGKTIDSYKWVKTPNGQIKRI